MAKGFRKGLAEPASDFTAQANGWSMPELKNAMNFSCRPKSPPPAEPTESDLVVTFGGEATAVGTDTLAQGDLFSRVIDKGPATIAFGSARFTAVAQGECGEAVLASADTFFDFSGADFVFLFETSSSRTSEKAGETTATETAFLKFFAIDIENWESPGGPVVIETTSQGQFGPGFWGFGSMGMGGGRKGPKLDGNVATLNIDAEAEGTDTLVDVQADVLAVEDQLSTVASVVTTGVG